MLKASCGGTPPAHVYPVLSRHCDTRASLRGTGFLSFTPSVQVAAHKKVQPLGPLMLGDKHDRPRDRGGASWSSSTFPTLEITRSIRSFSFSGRNIGVCILQLLYLTASIKTCFAGIYLQLGFKVLIFAADALLFVHRSDFNATNLICFEQEGFVLCFRSNERPGFKLARLKSARSCLHRARERVKEERERRLGEQSAFCVHNFEVLPGEKQHFRA